jgi:hypothetical protein
MPARGGGRPNTTARSQCPSNVTTGDAPSSMKWEPNLVIDSACTVERWSGSQPVTDWGQALTTRCGRGGSMDQRDQVCGS